MPFTGTALVPIVSEKQVVNILEFHQAMTDLMGVRVVGATIMKDVTGLTVPLDAIEVREGKPGILRVSGKNRSGRKLRFSATERYGGGHSRRAAGADAGGRTALSQAVKLCGG
jgi:hypothetical protein